MSKYLKILFLFAKNCFQAELEFRFNFLLWVLVNLMWGAFRILAVYLIFNSIGTIAGWTKNEALVLSLLHSIFLSFMWITILPNIWEFPELIRKGDLDFAMLKPMNLRFLVSTRYIEFDQFVRLTIASILLYFLLNSMHIVLTPIAIINFSIISIAGFVVIYNFYFMVATTFLWIVSMENFQTIIGSINDSGNYPVDIYKGFFSLVFLYVIPVGFIATFPAKAILGKGGLELSVYAVIMAIVFSFLSQKFWHFALRHYSSASS